MTTLYAQPYDTSARGFYFEYASGLPHLAPVFRMPMLMFVGGR